MVRTLAGILTSSILCLSLGACDAIIGIPDRKVGAHLECDDEKCACTEGYADCDGDPSDGCEVPLSTSAVHCGACGNDCQNGDCIKGFCECQKGFLDCDNDPKNGCEAELAVDRDNCGTCGHSCLGGACKENRCQAFELQAFSYPQSISLVAGTLFVAVCSAPNADPVLQLPATGGDPSPLATGVDCGIFQTVSGETLYWANGTTIFANAFDKPAPGFQVAVANGALKHIGASATHLYWGTEDKMTKLGGMFRSAFPDGVPEPIGALPAGGFAIDEQRAYWTDAMGLHSIGHTEAKATDVAGVGSAPGSLAIDGKTLYVMDYTDMASGILSFPLPAGPAAMIAPGAGTFAMAVDEGKLYWLDYIDGHVWQMPLATGEKRALADGLGYANNSDLAFDEKAIYWLSDQAVYKIAK